MARTTRGLPQVFGRNREASERPQNEQEGEERAEEPEEEQGEEHGQAQGQERDGQEAPRPVKPARKRPARDAPRRTPRRRAAQAAGQEAARRVRLGPAAKSVPLIPYLPLLLMRFRYQKGHWVRKVPSDAETSYPTAGSWKNPKKARCIYCPERNQVLPEGGGNNLASLHLPEVDPRNQSRLWAVQVGEVCAPKCPGASRELHFPLFKRYTACFLHLILCLLIISKIRRTFL